MSAVGRASDSGTRHDRAADYLDAWLRRSLHDAFDPVCEEPVPEELVRIVRDREDPRAYSPAAEPPFEESRE